jgi:hypothetical protein
MTPYINPQLVLCTQDDITQIELFDVRVSCIFVR